MHGEGALSRDLIGRTTEPAELAFLQGQSSMAW
jgi:hypothetical protein